ncbi:helix-turn-helix transcriptional regulator [Rhizobium sp. CFBP 8762]|uniref:helix-turn-helix transcriptional regulator n=1 Tax=Rhizobium sp. CFBP 8762 TaxID=2775279 RepID=UPI0017847C29|nr:helix-turn-helix transcriptional regulator [Rhizobium sp. CFBP 8762]MBD8556636.1 helix-turn-helix transcriptional regulator [Rhizobium sp. CFBP 8762]
MTDVQKFGSAIKGAVESGSGHMNYAVLHQLRTVALQFDFSWFVIARFAGGDHQHFAQQVMVCNWPGDLVREYNATGAFGACELVQAVRHTGLPVFMPSSLLAIPGFNEHIDRRFRAADFVNTLAARLHGVDGNPYFLALSGGRGPLHHDDMAHLYYALVEIFDGFDTNDSEGLKERLSSRELECLRWAAAGKSSDEIAIILGISSNTVSSYFKSAVRKLESVNRMQAIARAMRLKLI